MRRTKGGQVEVVEPEQISRAYELLIRASALLGGEMKSNLEPHDEGLSITQILAAVTRAVDDAMSVLVEPTRVHEMPPCTCGCPAGEHNVWEAVGHSCLKCECGWYSPNEPAKKKKGDGR